MLLRILNLIPTLLVLGTVVLLPIFACFNYYWDYILSPKYDASEVFDFIVVGSGSSGAVVANRLSKTSKVLLIEAGGNLPSSHISIPLLAQEIMHMPSINWNHKTVPQKYSSKGLTEQRSPWPRGKLLGGSSNLNYMFYVRGSNFDYDLWSNITGDDTWKYDNLLQYFKKSLDYNGAFKDNEKHYGQSAYGYLNVEKRQWGPLTDYFIDAGKELGYQELDLNGPQRPGFGHTEVSQKKGSRHGTYMAFLKNFINRPNLHISRYSQAIKIKLDKNNRAVGVWYLRHGKKYFAKASKEVILSGGTVDSPKVLMLSGIGPKKHLKSINIKPKVDLPVGQGLKDHLTVIVYPFIINKHLSTIPLRDLGIKTLWDYMVNGNGPLTTPGCLSSYAYVSTKYAIRKDWPDMQIYIGSGGFYDGLDDDLSRVLGYDYNKMRKYFEPLNGKEADAFVLLPTLVLPKSVGEITLQDKNPLTPPLIDPRYLQDERDVKTLIEGIKFSIKLGEETESFKRLNSTLIDIKFPGCEHLQSRSDQYWECYIRHTAATLYHPVGTCRMGKTTDKKAVVDSKLRVLNTIGLRVADASIMPEIINGNTNAACIMIGEIVSDFVREHWSNQYLVCNPMEYLGCPSYQNKCFYSKLL